MLNGLIALLAGLLIVWLFLTFYPGVGRTPSGEKQKEYENSSEAFHDGKFWSPGDTTMKLGKFSKKSGSVRPKDELPVTELSNPPRAGKGELRYTWLGHSSSLVQLGEQNILIDPVLTRYSSPVSFVGVKRFSNIAMRPEDVPEIDVLFLSHDHYDHMDYPTIRAIDGRVSRYLVPLGVDCILRGWGVDGGKITVLDRFDSTEINGVTYTLTPGQHFSGRNPLKRDITLWGGLYFSDGAHSVYYTGDTGFNEDIFEDVYLALGAPDLMLCECGQYDVGWPDCHMFPEESASAADIMQAQWAIPVHWGAFVLGNHAWKDPAERFSAAAERLGLRAAYPTIGKTVAFGSLEEHTEHWWESLR